MSEPKLSLGTRQLLTFLAGKMGSKGYCWWKQETIAIDMERGLRTVNRQIAELVAAGKLFTKPHGHGNHYSLQDLWGKMAYQTPAVENPVESAPVGVAATPNWRSASIGTELLRPEDSQHCSPVVGSTPAANDADCAEKPSPERQKPNPKPGSAVRSDDRTLAEVAEIREALKVRPLVRYTPAFDPVIREMLASGETVEVIQRAILQGCWKKLDQRDRGDTSLIFSMRYFAGVIPAVKGKADSGYWRHFEQRLGLEEQERGLQTSSGGRETGSSRAPAFASRSLEERDVA